MRKARLASLALVAAALLTLAALPATAGDGPGFHTSQPAMLTGVGGTSVTPIISVGDTVRGYMFDGIPDGISFSKINGNGTADILVNHELSLVPRDPTGSEQRPGQRAPAPPEQWRGPQGEVRDPH